MLATGLPAKLKQYYPSATVDFLVRKGNESLLQNNPNIRQVLVWNKKKDKLKNLFRLLKQIRSEKYDVVINLQRYFSTGMLTAFSGAKKKIGFDKNPFSFSYNTAVSHKANDGRHEIQRNHELIREITDDLVHKPQLFPSDDDYRKITAYCGQPFVTMTPSSVWFTKEYPAEKWAELIRSIAPYKIYILGGPDNKAEAELIIQAAGNDKATNLCGELSFLQSAALMKSAVMNFTNDSAPMHFASSMNAPVSAIFCSTIPEFGYGPLSDNAFIIQTKEDLACKPCGIHGRKACPLGHFKCGYTIETAQLLETLPVEYANAT